MSLLTAVAVIIAGIQFTPANKVNAAVTSSGGSGSWKLVWSEDFNGNVGSGVDTSVWNYDTGNSGWGNNEIQNYTTSTNNVYIADTSWDSESSDGRCLAIKAQRENGQITSGRLTTKGKQFARYGKIECKMRVQNGSQSGVWPAFWMMGENGNWPNCGEIDIMEHRNTENTAIGTLHWNPGTSLWDSYNHVYAGSETNGQFGYIGSIEQWHRYSVEWYGDVMKWFVDDTCYETMSISNATMEEFQRNHYILLNLAIGGPNTPFTQYQTVSDSFSNAIMYVDYVRVYQGSDSDFVINKKTENVTQPTQVDDGYTTCASDNTVNLGSWNYYVGSSWAGTAARYKGGSDLNDFSLKVTASGGQEWGMNAHTKKLSVTPGHTYSYSVTVNSNQAGASVFMKDEVGDINFGTKTLVSGDNVYSGTFKPTNDTVQFMFDLGKVAAGTTLNFKNVTLTDTTPSVIETTKAPEPTTVKPVTGDEEWITVDNSNNMYSYASADNITVVNVQHPGFANADGIYMSTKVAIGYVTINGNKVGNESVAIDGAGAIVYLTALSGTSTVAYYAQDGTLLGSVNIKKNETVPETTEAVTEATTERETHDMSKDPDDISRIYVVTDDANPTITKESKTPGTITVIGGEDGVNSVSDTGTIKLRGNSTSLADKAAYNISFSSKQTLFSGAKAAKKWCLLANAFDKTLIRNKLAMELGKELGMVATPEEHYADLYINGQLKGTYLVSEPADNGRSGVSYDETNDKEMMFELEADREEAGATYYTTNLGVRFVVEDPEGLGTDTAKYSNWVNTLSAFETALTDTSSDKVLDCINVDSFVDMYIVNELFNTVDFGYSSVKFYTKEDAKGNTIIYAGPLWDFDLSSGNSSVEECRKTDAFRCQQVNTWFGYLMKNSSFKNKVISKFRSMQPQIQNLYSENSLGISRINANLNYMGKSKDRNYSAISEGGAGWSQSTPDSAEYKYYPYGYSTLSPYINYTYDEHVEYLTNWLETRNKWMCSQWNINYNTAGSETISTDIDITGYQMTSSLNGIAGNMGMRVVYEVEPTVNGKEVSEKGLIYGLVYGNNPISESDLTYDSSSDYVKRYMATDAGKSSVQLGDSETASYYVMTMSCDAGDGTDNVTANAFTAKYYVRAYAKLADGSIVYSNVDSYTVYDIADYIYQNQLVSNKSSYDYLYTKILKYVNSSYKEGDYDWGNIVVK